MNEPTKPITGQGILWAIQQIDRHFEREIAKCGPVPKAETEETEPKAEALEALKR